MMLLLKRTPQKWRPQKKLRLAPVQAPLEEELNVYMSNHQFVASPTLHGSRVQIAPLFAICFSTTVEPTLML
jgi:hypothetical protein